MPAAPSRPRLSVRAAAGTSSVPDASRVVVPHACHRINETVELIPRLVVRDLDLSSQRSTCVVSGNWDPSLPVAWAFGTEG